MIETRQLVFTHDSGLAPALNAIDIQICPGEYIALVGPNGCGKTTLVRHFNALLMPSRGQVEIDGMDSRLARNHLEIRRRVGMVFQNPEHQIVGMSVEDDVAFGPGNLKLPGPEIRRRVGRALEMVGLQGVEKRIPYTLSGGEKQLLALAGLLAMEAAYIILDEAASSLDPASKARILKVLARLQGEGIAIVHVTHNMEDALKAERVIVMAGGQIAADGKTGQVLYNQDLLRSLGLAPPMVIELMGQLEGFISPADCPVLTVEDAAHLINARLWSRKQTNPNPDRG